MTEVNTKMDSLAQARMEMVVKGLNLVAYGALDDLPETISQHLAELNKEGRYKGWVLAGNGGPGMWNRLKKPVVEKDHPVDDFAIETVSKFLRQAVGEESPYFAYPSSIDRVPLQQLGHWAGFGLPSMLGVDINPTYGLWFAYRCFVLIENSLPLERHQIEKHPCETCVDKPCQSSCPVSAIGGSAKEYNLSACAEYRFVEDSLCADRCQSRLACPVGQTHRYPLEQIQYHMLRASHLSALKKYIKVPG